MYEIYCKLRERKGLSDYQVSKATGIPRSTFSDWKSGRYVPKAEKLQKLADYFNVSVDYLRTGKDAEKESTSGQKYYFDDDTAEKAQELSESPALRNLFNIAIDSRPEDLQMATDLLVRLKAYSQLISKVEGDK